MLRTCRTCKLEKDVKMFYFNINGYFSSDCKSCSINKNRHHRANRNRTYWSTSVTLRILNYKRHAKGRGLEFNISDQLATELIKGNCHYCGIEAQPLNGIDRPDNTKGYVVSNIVSCCKICNAAKTDLTLTEFNEWLQRLASYQLTKKHMCNVSFPSLNAL